jgi:hypothetical protein
MNLGGSSWDTHAGSGLLIGYARVSTDEQDLTAQRDAPTTLGVAPERIYVDRGLTGTNRTRPGLREAIAACRGGDVLVVAKLDRLARSLPDARDVAELTARDVALSLGGSVHDPTDPVGRLLFQRPSHGRRVRVRPDQDEDPGGYEGRPHEGSAAWQEAQAQPARQETHLGALHHAGTHTSAELAELFSSPAPMSTGRSSAHAQQPHPSPDVLPCTSGQLGSSGAG